jgi:hypothetical protein
VCNDALIPIGFTGAMRVRDEISRTGTAAGIVATAVLNFLIITDLS